MKQYNVFNGVFLNTFLKPDPNFSNLHLNCGWINDYDFDMFGRRVELYYKARSKKTSLIGLIFTSLYVAIFLVLFIYKLTKMLKKTEALIFYL